MIMDSQTNQLYLADCLSTKYPKFFKEFDMVLSRCDIKPNLLSPTKDIWAVDFMPIQIKKDRFVQFKYNPDYLSEYRDLVSDVDKICKAINLKPKKSELVIDGGNVVRHHETVIMCDKIFHENPKISDKNLIKQLKELFEVDRLFFVPWDTDDFIGHADGMVRFINSRTVLINDYVKENPEYHKSLRMALHNAGLDWVELPYNPPFDPTYTSARGLYLNYLQMEQAIIMPTFNSKFDDKAYRVLEEVFKGQKIETIDSSEIAREGGVLNCITWNIMI